MSLPSSVILLVEDNDDDVFLMKRALKSAGIVNAIQVVEDGQEAIDYLAGAGRFADRALFPYPGIVFLDLQMPRKSGFDVLAWLQSHLELTRPFIVVLSSSNSPRDSDLAAKLGAASYAVKPPTKQLFEQLTEQFDVTWHTIANAANSVAHVVKEV